MLVPYWREKHIYFANRANNCVLQSRNISECAAGYYGNGSATCTLCHDNRIKPDQGDSSDCDTECDAESEQPNEDHTQCGKMT